MPVVCRGGGWTVVYPPEQVRVLSDSRPVGLCSPGLGLCRARSDLLSTPRLPRGTEPLPEDWALGPAPGCLTCLHFLEGQVHPVLLIVIS